MYKVCRNYENLNKWNFEEAGKYGMPKIEPTLSDVCEYIGFNYARSCKIPEGKGVHFFLDDYQFIRLWNDPDKYIGLLQKFRYVLSPDFSLFTDYPVAMQIYNHYRKHWLAAYWQIHGIDVIPTICWSERESFNWCFEGEPVHGCVAVSSVGTQMRKADRESFMAGYREMIDRLQPEQIIFYGKVPKECAGNIISIGSFGDKWKCG